MSTGGMKLDPREEAEAATYIQKIKSITKFSLAVIIITAIFYPIVAQYINPFHTGGGAIVYQFNDPKYYDSHTTEEFFCPSPCFDDVITLLFFSDLNPNNTYLLFFANTEDEIDSLDYIVFGDNHTEYGVYYVINYIGGMTLCSFTANELIFIMTVTWEVA